METFALCLQQADQILVDFKEGKPDALSKVYDLFATNLMYTAIGIIKNEHEAEDIVLDAFEKCWVKRECFETLQKVKCYLYVVIKHACFHYLDKLKVKASSHKEIRYIAEYEEEYALQRMVKAEMMQRIYDEINQLPEKAKKLLTLLYVNGLSHLQVSAMMNIPVEHVRVNKARALKQLRIALMERKVLY